MKVQYASLESNGELRKVLELNTAGQLPAAGDTVRFRGVDSILAFRVLERSFYHSADPDNESTIQTGVTIILVQTGIEQIIKPAVEEEQKTS